jgi:hypothetical protein
VDILICRPEEGAGTAAVGEADFREKEVFWMPGLDGTGPAGIGPMTGWGRGYCNPSLGAYGPAPVFGPAYWGPGYGRGFARGPGFGRGRGFRRGFGRGPGWRGAFPAWGRWY